MKPLLILMRIVFVGIFWSIFFLEGIRVIMLKNWRFDIIRTEHWQYAWDLWLSGWIIDDTKEWAFVLIILTFIPLWLTGWAALSIVTWEKIFVSIALLPATLIRNLFFQPVKIIAASTGVKRIKKKKSYKEIRPKSIRAPMDEKIYTTASSAAPRTLVPSATPALPSPIASKTEPQKDSKFDHSLFKFDEEDDFDFDFDAFDEKKEEKAAPEPASTTSEAQAKPSKDKDRNKDKNNNNSKPQLPVKDNRNKAQKIAPQTNTPPSNAAPQNVPTAPGNQRSISNSTSDVIKQKGYEVLGGTTIKNNLVDFIGVAANQICICLIDKEPGDWLADEERFNDEEPLWFSESSHRISPVRKADISRQYLVEKLEAADLHFEVKVYVIEQIGNIINAEDMFEIWEDLGVIVTRIDRGTPKELKLFSKSLDEAIDSIDKDKLEKIKKLVRGLA